MALDIFIATWWLLLVIFIICSVKLWLHIGSEIRYREKRKLTNVRWGMWDK